MRKCGICQSNVDYAFNVFEEHVGTPPAPISKIIIKCTRGTKRKYIRGGVCQSCVDDLTIYYEALQTAKRIKAKMLEFIEKEDDCTKPLAFPMENTDEYQDDSRVEKEESQTRAVLDPDEIITENHDSDTELDLFEVIEPLPNNKEMCEDEICTKDIDEDCMTHKKVDDGNNSTELDTEDEGEETGPTCNVCGEQFPDYRSCKVHRSKMHPKRYVCQLCGKVLNTYTGLKKHIKLHNPDKPLACSVCGKRYHFEVDLKNHEAWHTGERTYECPECGKKFANFSSLSCHKISHKPLPDNITCDVCGKKFRKPSLLKTHQLTHATVKNYVCPYCKYCTANKMSLNFHLKNNKKCSVLSQMDAELKS